MYISGSHNYCHKSNVQVLATYLKFVLPSLLQAHKVFIE